MKRTLIAAAAICVALTGAAVARDDTTDPKKCELPVSQLNLRQQEDCKTYIQVEDGLNRSFEDARQAQKFNAAALERSRERAKAKEWWPPGAFEVCVTDHWQKDHWEPSCSLVR